MKITLNWASIRLTLRMYFTEDLLEVKKWIRFRSNISSIRKYMHLKNDVRSGTKSRVFQYNALSVQAKNQRETKISLQIKVIFRIFFKMFWLKISKLWINDQKALKVHDLMAKDRKMCLSFGIKPDVGFWIFGLLFGFERLTKSI